jgi:hypothetical protein
MQLIMGGESKRFALKTFDNFHRTGTMTAVHQPEAHLDCKTDAE